MGCAHGRPFVLGRQTGPDGVQMVLALGFWNTCLFIGLMTTGHMKSCPMPPSLLASCNLSDGFAFTWCHGSFFMYNGSKISNFLHINWPDLLKFNKSLKIEIRQGSTTVGCTPRQLLSRHSDMPSKNWSTTKVSQKEKTPKSSSMWTIHGLSMVDASICR